MENGKTRVMSPGSVFKKLTAYDHLLVFMGILTLLKVVSVFMYQNFADGLHLLKLTTGLFVGFSAIFLVFKYTADKKKTYKNALISAFILLLVLEHDSPYVLGGIMMFTLVHVAKFFIKVNNKNIFNPVVFGIAMVTFVSFLVPAIDTPPATFEIINFRFTIFGTEIPLAFVFILLSLLFNTRRINRFALAVSFIVPALLAGLCLPMDTNQYLLYALGISFTGAVIIVEPKTSPAKQKHQIIYGIAMALLVVTLHALHVPNALFIGLFAGNIFYAVYLHKIKPSTVKALALFIPTFPLLLLGCGNDPADKSTVQTVNTPHEEHVHQDEMPAFELNDGKKWQIDPNMMIHLRNMEKVAVSFGKAEQQDHKALADNLQGHIDLLVANCTMEGKAHDQLHLWLVPFMDLVKELAETHDDTEAARLSQKTAASFTTFNTYFE